MGARAQARDAAVVRLTEDAEAARAALDAGDTFYLPNLGQPSLREALADHLFVEQYAAEIEDDGADAAWC
jgi:aspartate/methionine/tyrosine aminotransferase